MLLPVERKIDYQYLVQIFFFYTMGHNTKDKVPISLNIRNKKQSYFKPSMFLESDSLYLIRLLSYFVSIFALSADFQLTKINIVNTGNQNHPDLEVRVVLVTCISNIGYF